MGETSGLPEPNKAALILSNYQLRRENRALHDKLGGIEVISNGLAEEMQQLREGVKKTLAARLQLLDGGVKAVDEKCEAEMQTLRDEVKTAQHTHAQEVARVLHESDEKRRVEIRTLIDEAKSAQQIHAEELTRVLKEADKKRGGQNQLLRDGMEAVQMRYNEMLERVKALEEAIHNTQPVGATNRPRKKLRTATSTSQNPTESTVNEAGPATKNLAPITQTDQGTPKSTPLPQTAVSATPAPDMDSSATIIASTPAVTVPPLSIPRFDDGHIRQGDLTLKEYTAACAHHVASIRATDANQGTGEPGPGEKEAIVKFITGMRENREKRQLAKDLEEGGWVVFQRGAMRVGTKILCGWAVIEEVLGGWENKKAGDERGERK
ncbi:hypothetical protein VE03_03977 [Pseudogymnoascus sp. 23342-1-I1]|nr:hypothetical protein VE03_03977 [Pseudogymnoascus sp. 23342-1-I1]